MKSQLTNALTVALAVTLGLGVCLQNIQASGSCFRLQYRCAEDFRCQCRNHPAGTDGTCDSRSYHTDGYYFCAPAPSGYWICRNRSAEVGWDATCSTAVNWTKWTYCYLLGGATCAYACAIAPTGPGCLGCLATMSKECFGCGIRYCVEGTRTPLYGLKVHPEDPWGRGCPDRLELP